MTAEEYIAKLKAKRNWGEKVTIPAEWLWELIKDVHQKGVEHQNANDLFNQLFK